MIPMITENDIYKMKKDDLIKLSNEMFDMVLTDREIELYELIDKRLAEIGD